HESEVFALIDAIFEEASPTLVNRGRARFWGVDLELLSRPIEQLELLFQYAYLDTQLLASDARLMHRPPHRLSAELGAELAGVRSALRWQWFSEQYSGDPFRSEEVRLGAYQQLDGELGYRLDRSLSLTASLFNILDANFQTAYGYPSRGRALFVTLVLEP
ncbi:MAG: TonB-dependent receptor, partial [Myxococcota bacterium]|nr:TonB-dependent receptor [Myxococcota bacterium]